MTPETATRSHHKRRFPGRGGRIRPRGRGPIVARASPPGHLSDARRRAGAGSCSPGSPRPTEGTPRRSSASPRSSGPSRSTIRASIPKTRPGSGRSATTTSLTTCLGSSTIWKWPGPSRSASSFGSTLALEALRREPGRFPRAALQGGFARRRLGAAERLALSMGRRLPGKVDRLPFHRQGLALNNRSTFPADLPDLWHFYVEENGRTPIASLVHRLDLLDRLDLRPSLPEYRPGGDRHPRDPPTKLCRWPGMRNSSPDWPDRTAVLMPGVGPPAALDAPSRAGGAGRRLLRRCRPGPGVTRRLGVRYNAGRSTESTKRGSSSWAK